MIKHLTVVDLNWIYRIQSSPVPPDLNEKHGPMYDENGKLPYVECISLEDDYDQIQNFREWE
ncbi:hypothetical protein GCM10010918_27070 [Paenibacillus radicis (ex Gao et al. 2016)]|uniref:Uncharacterized protein n=1 Tax=Paenibacillus radicis (ex Gao et al. 2016) TaxID=1737354 RepID=A0A917M0Y8_9BACL|nr:hypothetical protein GCM10010918_27070 [Paenibacillus radicis (ex Gao et al. 2016)]